MTKDVIVEVENTEIKRSSGFGRIVKSLSHPNVSKARQKYKKTLASAAFNSLSSREKAIYCRILEN